MSFNGYKALPLEWTEAHDAAVREALKAQPILVEWLKHHQTLASRRVVLGMLTDETPEKQIQVIAHDKGAVSMTMQLLADVDRLTEGLLSASDEASS